jgi:hypothetical protein
VCSITRVGFDPNRIGKGALSQKVKPGGGFKRFGHGFYFAFHSSKSHDYASEITVDGQRVRCQLMCRVILGKAHELFKDHPNLIAAPNAGDGTTCDSVFAGVKNAENGGNLNFPEAVVYDCAQCIPIAAMFYTY